MDKGYRKVLVFIVTILLMASLLTARFVYVLGRGEADIYSYLSIAVELVGLLILTVLMLGCYTVSDTNPESGKSFSLFLLMEAVSFFADAISFSGEALTDSFSEVCTVAGNSVLFLANISLLYAFAAYLFDVVPKKSVAYRAYFGAIRVYFLILLAALIANLRFGFIFTTVDGCYRRGPLSWIPFVMSALFTLALLFDLRVQKMEKAEKAAFLFYILLPLVANVIQLLAPGFAYVQVALLISTCVVFVQGHVRQSHLLQQQKLERQQQETALLLTQIQPHFISNTLTSIASLCETDPATAHQVTLDFADYLRENLSVLACDKPVEMSLEIRHIRKYVGIEQVRFGERIKADFQIGPDSFLLPALTVQPLVENAIKHGLRPKHEGGTVTVATGEEDGYWTVTVSDDGVGFDSAAPSDGKMHVGIANVRSRLAHMGGTLTVSGTPGVGTVATVRIPKHA